MPRARVSDDIDHVPIDPKPTRLPKKPAPKPWPLPAFEPIQITNPLTYGHGLLPDDVPSDAPFAIFSLFFDDSTLIILRDHTNEYAELYPGADSAGARLWFPYGCGLCGIHLCQNLRCWEEHIRAIE